ncbi:MAG: hypothetical protein LUE27_01760 [Clostridia bacterium]|nr:hypothetical protein [Clostridia bacterium]
MDEKKIDRAAEDCMKNEYWKTEAAAAPSADSARHLRLEMYYAFHNGFSAPRLSRQEILEIFAEMYESEDRFAPADWAFLKRRSAGTTFARICDFRSELLERGALSYPKWRYIYKYISKKNPFRSVAKERLDRFTDPASYPEELTENRRMQEAISKASRDSHWKRIYDSCPGLDERSLMELCAYFAEQRTLGHYIQTLISLRYDKGGKAWEYLEESGVFNYMRISSDDMFESVRF